MQYKSKAIAVLIMTLSATGVAWVAKHESPSAWPVWLWTPAQAMERVTGSDEVFSGDARQWKNWLGQFDRASAEPNDSRGIAVKQDNDSVEFILPRLDRAERFDVQVAVSWNERKRTDGCGLLLGVSRDARYAFTVTADGRAAVGMLKSSPGGSVDYQPLTSPKFVPEAIQHRQNALTVQVRGQKLSFLVNNQPVAEIVDTMMLNNWVLGVFAQGHRNVTFDNLMTGA